MKKYITQFASALLCSLGVLANAEFPEPAYSVTALWESQYNSEGRNNLEDGGLVSIEGSMEVDALAFGIWYAAADSTSYNELNLSVAYALPLDSVDASIAFTRLEFINDDESDNEISAGVATELFYGLSAGVDVTYSTEAEGSFVEGWLGAGIDFLEGQLTVEPYLLKAYDFGYATDAHDGANHLQLGCDLSLSVTDQLRVVGCLAQAWAQEDVDKDGLGDEFWGSFGFTAEF